jgi:hypothetical protein
MNKKQLQKLERSAYLKKDVGKQKITESDHKSGKKLSDLLLKMAESNIDINELIDALQIIQDSHPDDEIKLLGNYVGYDGGIDEITVHVQTKTKTRNRKIRKELLYSKR